MYALRILPVMSKLSANLLLYLLSSTLSTSLATSLLDSNNEYIEQQLPLQHLPQGRISGSPSASHEFTLRHIFHHGTYQYPELHRRLDIQPGMQVWVSTSEKSKDRQALSPFLARSRPEKIHRLRDRRVSAVETQIAAAREQGQAQMLDINAWSLDEIPGPDVTDKGTVLSLAKMTLDAYIQEPFTRDWKDVKEGFNYSQSFGWEEDGLRGHIFADADNSTIVIAIKGTSAAVFDGAETTTNDKINDNLFFSCCCAQQGSFLWREVCSCKSSTFTCNQTCLEGELRQENRYYRAALDLYSNTTELYPDSNVWLAGHSLGGAVSSFVGLTYGLPAVTFEAVPEALPAARLGLPVPPGSVLGAPQTRQYTGTYHFGQTADPVYMGTCHGITSACTLGGYAFESQCHTGYRCVYDTVGDRGWRVGIGNHKISNVITSVIEEYDTVPPCVPDSECRDCINWKFFRSNGSTTSTKASTSSTPTSTRTSVCKTPGWWGCLDKTTTSMETSSSSTLTISTTHTSTSCHSWGWFGCKDPETPTKNYLPRATVAAALQPPLRTPTSAQSWPDL